jgi:hypothetical protein
MIEFNQLYNLNSLYIVMIVFIYTNYEYMNIIFDKLYLLNNISIIIIVNIIGLFLFLKYLTFEINIKIAYKI